MHTQKFGGMALSQEILKAIDAAGYSSPTPIQREAIPAILADRDIFGCAQTGTGKTAAFVLPIIDKLMRGRHTPRKQFRALILAPTRELAEQINTSVSVYGKFAGLSHAKVYGGVPQGAQVRALAEGVDILIATPGRLLDLHKQKKLEFDAVEIFVLDEADRMLDMGFIKDIYKIASYLPHRRQSLLFSATLSDEIQGLAARIVNNPLRITISPESPTVDKIDQRLYYVSDEDKGDLMKHLISERLKTNRDALTLVFCRTKHGANKVAKKLSSNEFCGEVIHGNKSQSARQNALERFRAKKSKVLVATDIAARGIDVKDMSLVINYDLPEEAETYVHRIGRTARAEASGEAISFFTTSDFTLLRAIEKLIKKRIPDADENPFHSEAAQNVREGKARGTPKPPRGGQRQQQRRGSNENSERKDFDKPREKRPSRAPTKPGSSRPFGHFHKQKKNRPNRGGR